MTKFNIYVLQCEHAKYYVGKANLDVTQVFQYHIKQKNCKWTKIHPPISVINTFIGDKWDEEVTFYKMADEYGIENVRGGSYKDVILTSKQKKTFDCLLSAVSGLCHKCKKSGHSESKCLLFLDDKNIELEDVPEANGIFVLRLQNDKWFVNYSRTMRSSIMKHFEGEGSKWTKLHVPSAIHKIYPGLPKDKLNNITFDYIEQFGRENVRGGDWSKC